MDDYEEYDQEEFLILWQYMKDNNLCLRPAAEGGAFKIYGEQDCIDTKRWGEDSITGPDGGYGCGWKCGVCSAKILL